MKFHKLLYIRWIAWLYLFIYFFNLQLVNLSFFFIADCSKVYCEILYINVIKSRLLKRGIILLSKMWIWFTHVKLLQLKKEMILCMTNLCSDFKGEIQNLKAFYRSLKIYKISNRVFVNCKTKACLLLLLFSALYFSFYTEEKYPLHENFK